MPPDGLHARLERLVEVLRSYESTIVAFSGGVDSALVAAAAQRALGGAAIAVTSDSPTLPRSDLGEAAQTAREIGIRFFAVERNELDDPRFAANPVDRCFFCKQGLQEDLMELQKEIGAKTVSYGVNASDLHEWRPGVEATRALGARFPLVEAGFDKDLVREGAKEWGLRVWDKPASPCLASRIPYGERVTAEKLRLIEEAEAFIRHLGFMDVRVRHLDGAARVEVPPSDVGRLFAIGSFVEERLTQLGFDAVRLDPRGLKSGRLHEEHTEAMLPGQSA